MPRAKLDFQIDTIKQDILKMTKVLLLLLIKTSLNGVLNVSIIIVPRQKKHSLN